MRIDYTEARYTRKVRVGWTVRVGGQVVREGFNTFTDYGLTNLAKSWAGKGSAPVYLVIDNFYATIQDTTLNVGATSVTTDKRVDLTGDSQIILDLGGSNQETVSFTSATDNGNGTFTYTISATVNAHSAGEWVARQVLQSDTLASVQSEVQYDSAAAPNARMKATDSGGYSGGTGNYVMQFFLTGNQAVTQWVTLGLSDNPTVGQGNLHNHINFGYDHQQGNDVELDISLTVNN